MEWFISNLGNIIVSIILVTIIGFAIRKMVRDRKAGKSSCGCNCGCCAMSGSCHADKQKTE